MGTESTQPEQSAVEPGPPARRLLRSASSGFVVLLLVLASATVRVRTALADPEFDAVEARGLLKSDPALLFYVTERIVEAGGGVPDDFRADPRIQHPETTDIAAEFTVGQEFLTAWFHATLGGGRPLHLNALLLAALLASLVLPAVWIGARALGASRWLALLATALAAVLPANYRTIGFILVREDLAFPLFALHVAFGLRAARARRGVDFLASGGLLAAALATWHALAFFLLLELLVLVAWRLVDPRPLGAAARRGLLALALPPLGAALLVPALRASDLVFSPAFGLAAGLVVLGCRGGSPRRGSVALASGFGLGLALLLRAALGSGGHDHVFEVLVAKLAHGGVLPADPARISFDARLLWQGPFATLTLREASWFLGLVPVLVVGLAALLRRRLEAGALAAVLAFAAASLVMAWLVQRTALLPGFLLPLALAGLVARVDTSLKSGIPGVGFVLAHAFLLSAYLRDFQSPWYQPPGRNAEIRALVRWVEAELPSEAAILGDFMNSTAILAHTRRAIVLQPKYETERSRRRAEDFLTAYFHGTPADVRRLATERFDCGYVLFDRYTLGYLSRYTGGLAVDARAWPPGSAAETFQSVEADVLENVPGFELVYRSPTTIRQSNGAPYDLFRLYRVTDVR